MFYICDCSDLMNIGVKDTKDGSIEYFSSFKLQSLVSQGTDIAGYQRMIVYLKCQMILTVSIILEIF